MANYKINTLLLLAGGPHGITMADTPSRPVTFASRTVETRIDGDCNNHEDITCEAADIHDDQTSNQSTTYLGMGVEQGSVDVPGNVCVNEYQPSKIDERDKAKNKFFGLFVHFSRYIFHCRSAVMACNCALCVCVYV